MRYPSALGTLRAITLAFALATGGCSGGSSGTPVAPPSAAPSAQHLAPASVQVTIAWPARATAAAATRRTPAYVSAATQSLTISVDGTSLLEADDPSNGAAVTQTYTILVTPGTPTFLIALYDATGGKGNLVGRSTTIQTVTSGIANALKIVVDGQLASIKIVPVPNPYLETAVAGATYTLVGPLAQTFTLVPLDPDGFTVVAPGKIPEIALAAPAGAGVTATAIAGTTNQYAVSAPIPTTAVTLTASGTNLDDAPVTATTTVQSLAALYVTDPIAHRIAVLDDAGRALTFPATAFADVQDTHGCGPHGITYAPPDAASATPRLFVARCTGNPSAGGPGNVGIFDLLGNEIVPATPFAPNMPQFVALDPQSRIVVTDAGVTDADASLDFYDENGNLLTSNAGPHPRAFEQANAPNQLAFDPSTATPDYVIADNTGYVERYTNAGVFVAKTAAGSSPGGIAWDANEKWFYVTTYGGVGPVGVPPVPAGQRGTLYAFDATLTQQTTGAANATAFMGLSTRPTGVVVDPYDHVLYVADYAGNKIVTFNEDGSSSTRFAAAVTSVVDPLAMTLAP